MTNESELSKTIRRGLRRLADEPAENLDRCTICGGSLDQHMKDSQQARVKEGLTR